MRLRFSFASLQEEIILILRLDGTVGGVVRVFVFEIRRENEKNMENVRIADVFDAALCFGSGIL